jgi:hypothetical protein
VNVGGGGGVPPPDELVLPPPQAENETSDTIINANRNDFMALSGPTQFSHAKFGFATQVWGF